MSTIVSCDRCSSVPAQASAVYVKKDRLHADRWYDLCETCQAELGQWFQSGVDRR